VGPDGDTKRHQADRYPIAAARPQAPLSSNQGPRRTRIVCTIGPASRDRVGELIDAGMDIARINLSHGTRRERAAAVSLVRQAAVRANREIGLLVDLPGPKVRIGVFEDGAAELHAGLAVLIVRDDGPATASRLTTSHPGLVDDLRPGDRVLLADGAVELAVVDADEPAGTVTLEVVRGGTVRSNAGMSVPAERLSLPALTRQDLALLDELRDLEPELVGQSFVRAAADVDDLRTALGSDPARIVAKIETRPAVEAIAAILASADAIMVARGDLGVEIPYEAVPIVQKRLIAAARAAGRPVIVATQMLESMTHASRPTRAEASDVANAVLDGADAVMLSAETAIGDFPVEATAAAARIIAYAEAAPEDPWPDAPGASERPKS
jgi:pyruvate kinase